MKAMTKTSLVFLAVLALAGCPEDDGETEPPPTKPTQETTTTAETTTTTTSELQVDTGDKNPAITALVKTELDGRKDGGATGAKLTIPGAQVSFQTVEAWKDGKSGAFVTSESADGKSRWAGGTSSGGRDGASGALGLTNCQWNPDESATVGADELAATVADGICDRGAGKAKAASVTFGSQNAVAVGAWDDGGGDSNAVMSIFRSAKKAATGGPPGGLAACCQALKQNSVSAPPEQKGAYLAAYGACQAMIAAAPPGYASQLRAMLRGASLPAPCQ